MDLHNLILQFNKLEFKDKRDIYQKIFSLGNLSTADMNDKLILISLIALVFKKMKEKDKDVTILAILLKITGQPKDNSSYYQFLETLAIISEDFSYNTEKIDSCGLKTSQDIIKRIKEILNTWLPF